MSDDMRDDGHLPATKADLREFATKGDLSGMRGDITVMRGDIAVMRSDILVMRDDILAAMRDMLRPITITLAHHTAELADIRGHIKEKMVTRDEFHSRMDGFAGRVADSDYSSAKNRARLDEHEERLKKLESRPS